jgi:hypothetical protein
MSAASDSAPGAREGAAESQSSGSAIRTRVESLAPAATMIYHSRSRVLRPTSMRKPINILDFLEVADDICRIRPHGECNLVGAVELINRGIGYCRERKIPRLMFNATGLVGIPIPNLVDRFLMAEEWAEKAQGMVVVVLVVHAEYIHPEKFGVKVARDLGLTCDVYTSEGEGLKWLSVGI